MIVLCCAHVCVLAHPKEPTPRPSPQPPPTPSPPSFRIWSTKNPLCEPMEAHFSTKPRFTFNQIKSDALNGHEMSFFWRVRGKVDPPYVCRRVLKKGS